MTLDDGNRTLVGAGAVAAAAIVVSAAMLLAPFLAFLALPLIVGTVLYGKGKGAGLAWLFVGGLLYGAIAVMFVVNSSDFDWEVADFVFILVGGPAAVVTAALAGIQFVQKRRSPQHSGSGHSLQ